jgi:tripartite-type tricarboxylate transporter receptor subunit TctC
MGPRGMPREIISRLHAELVAALNHAEVRSRFAQQGFDVVANRPEEYGEFQRREIERWREVVRRKGLTPE